MPKHIRWIGPILALGNIIKKMHLSSTITRCWWTLRANNSATFEIDRQKKGRCWCWWVLTAQVDTCKGWTEAGIKRAGGRREWWKCESVKFWNSDTRGGWFVVVRGGGWYKRSRGGSRWENQAGRCSEHLHCSSRPLVSVTQPPFPSSVIYQTGISAILSSFSI